MQIRTQHNTNVPAWLMGTLAIGCLSGYACGQIFTDIDADLGPTGFTSFIPGDGPPAVLQWGDYDNDGDLDLIVTGFGQQYIPNGLFTRTTAYRNDGNDTFTANISTFPETPGGAVHWGDFDNDADLDLLISGSDDNEIFTSLFKNLGGGQFQNTFADLIPAANGSVEWGDFDNDGDQDILQTGANGNPFTRLYRNQGNGDFEIVEAGLEQVTAGEAIFTDYDNDGDLDIVLGGSTFDGTPVTQIYRNDGSNSWVNIEADLPGLLSLTIDAGDYDGDGDVDLVVTGAPSEFSDGQTFIYRNEGADTFVQDDQPIVDVFNGDAQWGDYDNDDDLDLLVAGLDSPFSPQKFVRLYENDGTGTLNEVQNTGLPDGLKAFQWGDYDNDGDLDLAAIGDPVIDEDGDGQDDTSTVPQTWVFRNDLSNEANAVPAPTSLDIDVQDNGDVTFSWQQPQSFDGPLTFNLRVSTTPQDMNVVTSMTDPVLNSRLVAEGGNVGTNTSWTVHDLSEGEYYWSVQAIAANQGASTFAAEQSFTIDADDAPDADLSGNGSVDVPDLLILLSVWGNADALPAADLNGDGAVDVQDLLVLLSQWG